MNSDSYIKLRGPRLIICGNGIGNSQDIPPRTIDAIKHADITVFESQRQARQTLKAAGIHRDFIILSEHEEKTTLELVDQAFHSSKTVTLMSDQGMPGVEDPGRSVIKRAYAAKIKIEIVPGPSSITCAVSACPFPMTEYLICGFLPQKSTERIKKIRELAQWKVPLVVLDTPYRLLNCLEDVARELPDRQIFLALDIGQASEEYHYGKTKLIISLPSIKKEDKNFILIIDKNRN